MKIVIAPDSFKESLSSEEVAEAIKRGFQQSLADVDYLLCPVGDGGEGTVDAIRHSLDLEEKWIQVTGPFGPKESMRYFKKGELALFELVVVGEGRLDRQSLAGKAPIGVAKRTPVGVPVIAICGSLAEDLPPLPFENIQAAFSILEKSEPLEDSLKNARLYLERTAANIGYLLTMRKI